MRNTDQTSNVFDKHNQLREDVVKKTRGEAGSLNFLSIPKYNPKLADEERSYEEPLSPVACLTTGRLYHSYIFIIVGFKKDIDVESFKISLQNTVAQHQRFSSILVSIPSHYFVKIQIESRVVYSMVLCCFFIYYS